MIIQDQPISIERIQNGFLVNRKYFLDQGVVAENCSETMAFRTVEELYEFLKKHFSPHDSA